MAPHSDPRSATMRTTNDRRLSLPNHSQASTLSLSHEAISCFSSEAIAIVAAPFPIANHSTVAISSQISPDLSRSGQIGVLTVAIAPIAIVAKTIFFAAPFSIADHSSTVAISCQISLDLARSGQIGVLTVAIVAESISFAAPFPIADNSSTVPDPTIASEQLCVNAGPEVMIWERETAGSKGMEKLQLILQLRV